MPKDEIIDLFCPAKVNLALSVGPLGVDELHPIASWMVAVDFCDHLTMTRLESGKAAFDIAYEMTAPKPVPVDWPLEKDQAYRAIVLMEQHLGKSLPVNVTLRKRIPTGAGLGDGSSNGAGTLVGLNRLFDLDLDNAVMMRLATQLGSDVPFLVQAIGGQTSAVVTGFGEKIEPLPLNHSNTIPFPRRKTLGGGHPANNKGSCPPREDGDIRDSPRQIIHLVLLFPPTSCSTADVYQAFDRLTPDTNPPDINRVRTLTRINPLPHDGPFNDLTDAAIEVHPDLGKIRCELANTLGHPVHLTGSGSALFVVTSNADACDQLAQTAERLADLPAIATRTL